MEKRELTCIGCPMGCQISVTTEQGKILKVEGNTCKIGDTYARQEVTTPARIVTSTVKVMGGVLPVVSVKTRTDVPKDKVFEVIEALRDISLQAPVEIGQIVLKDVCATGVDVVATKGVACADK